MDDVNHGVLCCQLTGSYLLCDVDGFDDSEFE